MKRPLGRFKLTSRKRNNILVFKTKDPEGREVSLQKDVWENHICSGHPEVRQDSVQKTIENPNIISESEKHISSYVYSNNSITKSQLYVNVIVRFTDKGRKKGDVRTSYVSSKLPKGKPIWVNKKYTT